MTSGPRAQPNQRRARSVGPTGWPADHPGRPTAQWAPPPLPSTWHPLIGLLTRFQEAWWLQDPGLPPINSRGGGENRVTPHTTQLTSLPLELGGPHPRCFRQPRRCRKVRSRVRRSRGKCRVCRHSSPLVPRRMLIRL